MQRPGVLSIAGSDSAGLAGIQRDNHTIVALGGHPLNVISANTAQDGEGVKAINAVTIESFSTQFEAARTNRPAAIKTGLLATEKQIDLLAQYYAQTQVTPPLVIDPVFSATSGDTFSHSNLIASLKQKLLPHCTLLTPNLNEASQLCGFAVTSPQDMIDSAHTLLAMGAKSVLLKGGHLSENDKISCDYFASEHESFWLSSPRQQTKNTRGTGCALASAIACALALGYPINDAVVIGKMAINQGLRQAYSRTDHAGPIAISHFPNSEIDLPTLTSSLAQPVTAKFPEPSLPDSTQTKLGLYPVVDNIEWLERLLPLGVSTIQLRIKNLTESELAESIKHAVDIANRYNCRLFINDYWQLAIRYGAYGVHLGQEDLHTADITAIYRAGLRLGVSTHCHTEVARAHALKPSYIACGPVYHTDTKQMPWQPHGPEGFAYWRKLLNYPLVAIGGINSERLAHVHAEKPDGIAMITAITLADNPEQVTQQFLSITNQIT